MNVGPFVWLGSYPKSGGTWLRLFLAALNKGIPPPLSEAFSRLMPSVYSAERFEQRLGVRVADLSIDQLLALRPVFLRIEATTVTDTSFRKTHDAWSEALLPSDLAHAAIYLVRDPRDVALSYAYQNGWSVDRAIEWMSDPGAKLVDPPEGRPRQLPQCLGDWNSHVLSWVYMTGLPLLVLRYEDLLAQPKREFSACVRFLGLTAGEDAIAAAIAATSFGVLKVREAVEGFAERAGGDRAFFRAGNAGLWRTQLTAAQRRSIEKRHGGSMARFGYLP